MAHSRVAARVESLKGVRLTEAPAHVVAKLLAKEAARGKLTIYAGAGISMGEPTALPGSWVLAEAIRAALCHDFDFDSIPAGDLLAIADSVGDTPTGKRLLRSTMLDVADFKGARPNDAHAGLALMILEGAATVIETNYDDCVERSVHYERLSVVIEDDDRIDMDMHALLKVHGCAHKPATMLVTTEDLRNPPLYARTELASRLSQGTVVFLGIGSTADYVEDSIKRLLAHVSTERLYVVGKVVEDWQASGWAQFLPDLPEDQRLGLEASEFVRLLAAKYLESMLGSLEVAAAAILPEDPSQHGVSTICSQLRQSPIASLSWLRGATWPRKSGFASAASQVTYKGLLALGTLLDQDARFKVPITGSVDAPDGLVRLDDESSLMLLVASEMVHGTLAAREAVTRVQQARTSNHLPHDSEVVVVCSGPAGSLGPDEVVTRRGASLGEVLRAGRGSVGLLPVDIMADPEPTSVLDSSLAGQMYLVSSELLIG